MLELLSFLMIFEQQLLSRYVNAEFAVVAVLLNVIPNSSLSLLIPVNYSWLLDNPDFQLTTIERH